MSKKKSPPTPRKPHNAWRVLGWFAAMLVLLGFAAWIGDIWLEPRMDEYRLSRTGTTAIGQVDHHFTRMHRVEGNKWTVAHDVEVEYVHVHYGIVESNFVDKDDLKDGVFVVVTYLPEDPLKARLGPRKETLLQIADLDSFGGIFIAVMILASMLVLGGTAVLCGYVACWELGLVPIRVDQHQ